MIFENGQRVVFAGDSITDRGRRGPAAPLGDGYVALLRAVVAARHPALDLTWLNRGVSGDTVRDLARRWDTDVIAERPDWLSVMIGINDVWRGRGGNPAEAVPLAEYTATLRDLLRRLVVATPYLIEPDRTDPWRAESDRFAAAVRQLAAEFGAPLVDTQAAFDAALATSTPATWAADRVHPGLPGHALLAEAFLQTIEPITAS